MIPSIEVPGTSKSVSILAVDGEDTLSFPVKSIDVILYAYIVFSSTDISVYSLDVGFSINSSVAKLSELL